MNLRVLVVQGQKSPWTEDAIADFLKKLKPLCKIEFLSLKGSKKARNDSDAKIQDESERILKTLTSDDYVILCDERGREFSSRGFADFLQTLSDEGIRNLVFIIGGPFGVNEEVKSRASLSLKLSPMTMNHHVAATVLLEQIYRSRMIQLGKPYHND